MMILNTSMGKFHQHTYAFLTGTRVEQDKIYGFGRQRYMEALAFFLEQSNYRMLRLEPGETIIA